MYKDTKYFDWVQCSADYMTKLFYLEQYKTVNRGQI